MNQSGRMSVERAIEIAGVVAARTRANLKNFDAHRIATAVPGWAD
jgi:hypothetical protein